MASNARSVLPAIIEEHRNAILGQWQDVLIASVDGSAGRSTEVELREQSRRFYDLLTAAIRAGGLDVDQSPYGPVRDMLVEFSRSRAVQGFTPRETALFVFSLKEPIFRAANGMSGESAKDMATTLQQATDLLDRLGLFTIEAYQKGREEVIARQGREIAELSTPVVKLWQGVLALPLIGTLDSERTQVVMENLLQSIVDQSAEIAIIDITGVPTVDTLVAQHLIKTVSAARLMGADCIISGIRPQIAQTMVHLGVELNVVSKATLADAFALAMQRVGLMVVRRRTPDSPQAA